MIKKEFSEVGQQILFYVLTIVLFPLLVKVALFSDTSASYADVFFPLFQMGLIFWSLFLGISLFSTERRNQGIEYILSLPYSRLKLLYYKILPRLGALVIFYALFVILYGSIGSERMIMTLPSFSYIYFIIFILSLYFSVAQDNFIASFMSALITTTALFFIFIFVYKVTIIVKGSGSYWFSFQDIFYIPDLYSTPRLVFFAILSLILPFILSFIYAFKRFDLRPAQKFNKRYFKLLLPMFIVGILFSFIFATIGVQPSYTNYYLIHKHKVIKDTEFSSFFYDQKGEHKLKTPGIYLWSQVEKDQILYTMARMDRVQVIISLNLNTLEEKIIYNPGADIHLGYRLYLFEDKLYFFQYKDRKRYSHLMRLNIQTNKVSAVPIPDQFSFQFSTNIIGTDEINGKRFWLLNDLARKGRRRLKGCVTYQLFEDGSIKDLGLSKGQAPI